MGRSPGLDPFPLKAHTQATLDKELKSPASRCLLFKAHRSQEHHSPTNAFAFGLWWPDCTLSRAPRPPAPPWGAAWTYCDLRPDRPVTQSIATPDPVVSVGHPGRNPTVWAWPHLAMGIRPLTVFTSLACSQSVPHAPLLGVDCHPRTTYCLHSCLRQHNLRQVRRLDETTAGCELILH